MAEWELIGKLGGGGSELQEWYYNHSSNGNIPTVEENPVIAKVEEATPEEPALVLITTNMRNMQSHNNPWEELMGSYTGSSSFSNGKYKHAYLVTEPGELRLTSFSGWQGRGEYHTRAYITRLSDYAPM